MIHQTRFELPEIGINVEGDLLVFDKPYQCTSFDLVGKVKKYIRQAEGRKQKGEKGKGEEPLFSKATLVAERRKVKVGHAGTLDPLATGVMIICVGSFTKKIEQYQAQEKEYTGTFMLGATTPSFDLEKPVDETFPIGHITEEKIYQAVQSFVGEQDQVPPHFSAVKVDGKRAYLLAREGKEPEIKPKKITISEFEITRIALPEIDFKIVCSKGTYIRSIARDFGQKLESGAHLTALRRTRIGEFKVEEAINVQLSEP
ncbi:MAG: tRNA pseudouridine(55) synthase TruB [Bacteroidetes bacterium]|nr:tRNA pseudouridine(55) synthase TruB [Bacteroidota bacterium]